MTDIGYKIIQLRSDPAIQFHSCFISYSSQDDDFARRLHADLQKAGVRCGFAPEHMKIGSKIRPAIHDAIRLHDKLLLILSKHSVSSQWVEDEVERALDKERRDTTTVLFPIRLDEAVMDSDSGWASTVKRTRHVGDFRCWKDHDVYRTSFECLLRDLGDCLVSQSAGEHERFSRTALLDFEGRSGATDRKTEPKGEGTEERWTEKRRA